MKTIVCVDKNWAIGKNGDLLFHIPADLKYFKQVTQNHVVVYGRKTLETFPKQQPLPNRDNYVLTRDTNFSQPNIQALHSLDEIKALEKKYPTDEIFIIGGASVYQSTIDDCSYAYVTVVDSQVDGADAFFPNLSEKANWTRVKVGETQEHNGLKFHFEEWTNSSFNS